MSGSLLGGSAKTQLDGEFRLERFQRRDPLVFWMNPLEHKLQRRFRRSFVLEDAEVAAQVVQRLAGLGIDTPRRDRAGTPPAAIVEIVIEVQ